MINIRQIKLLYNIILCCCVYIAIPHHLTPSTSLSSVFFHSVFDFFFMVHLSLLYFWCFLCFKGYFFCFPLYKQTAPQPLVPLSPPPPKTTTNRKKQTYKKWYLFIWNESVSCLLYYWCFLCVCICVWVCMLLLGEVINLLLLAFLTLWNVSLYISHTKSNCNRFGARKTMNFRSIFFYISLYSVYRRCQIWLVLDYSYSSLWLRLKIIIKVYFQLEKSLVCSKGKLWFSELSLFKSCIWKYF